MREINGYVFIPRFENHGIIFEPLFGPNTGGNNKRAYNNLEVNGIVPFPDYISTVNSAEVYLNEMTSCSSIDFGRLAMKIAETELELEKFRRLEKLIVIMRSGEHQGDRLLGPYIEGKPGFGAIPGSFLISTSLKHIPLQIVIT